MGYRYRANPRNVTPLAGVWIEIVPGGGRRRSPRSHPSRVCGLKCLELSLDRDRGPVTPLAGVWIEIRIPIQSVAARCRSHPSRVCGLKFLPQPWSRIPSSVTPLAGVWIEIFGVAAHEPLQPIVTPLAGVWIEIRVGYRYRANPRKSHPSRVCGLKSGDFCGQAQNLRVTPLAGVWIEIGSISIRRACTTRHTPRGCVD